jgi:hypothetical protein
MAATARNPAAWRADRVSEAFCVAAEPSEDTESLAQVQDRNDTVLGVDIGNRGANALVSRDGELIDIFDMPCLNDGPSGRRAVNAPLLAEIVAQSHACKAFVELVTSRPKEGAVGAFSFGRSRGR